MSEVELHRPPFWRAVGITFETVWRNLGICVVLSVAYAALTAVPTVVFGTFAPDIDPLRMSGAEAFAVVAFAVAAMASFILGGLIVYPPTLGGLALVGAAGVAQEPVDLVGVVRRAIDRAIPASGAFMLVFLTAIAAPAGIAVVGVLVAVAAGLDAAVPLLAGAGLSAIFPGVYLTVRLSLAVPIVVLEGEGPIEAYRRSWGLMHGAVGWAFGVYLVIGIVCAVTIALLGAIPLTARTASAPDFVIATMRNVVAGVVGVSLSGVAVGVVYAAREVPPDDVQTEDARRHDAKTPPPMIPVPIPLHAFDPPEKRQ